MLERVFIRKLYGATYLENFLVAAVTTLLGIRFYLELTRYPQIGGHGLHIAHMLWGGLLMLIAIILLLAFTHKSIDHFSAIIGGAGFGTFIDELGKFITHDNNYFFEPTIALIYVIFILLYLSFRFIEHQHELTKEEYLSNAFDMVKNMALNGSNELEKETALHLLTHCDPANPAVVHLRTILGVLRPHELQDQTLLFRLQKVIKLWYRAVVHKKWFVWAVILFFIGYSLINLYKTFDVLLLYFKFNEFSLQFDDLGEFVSAVISTLIVLVGIPVMFRSRIAGYRLFKLSVLISIFITRFFDFYKNQFSALLILAFNVVILLVLQYNISEEQIRHSHETEDN